jgi:hypothetical protein
VKTCKNPADRQDEAIDMIRDNHKDVKISLWSIQFASATHSYNTHPYFSSEEYHILNVIILSPADIMPFCFALFAKNLEKKETALHRQT